MTETITPFISSKRTSPFISSHIHIYLQIALLGCPSIGRFPPPPCSSQLIIKHSNGHCNQFKGPSVPLQKYPLMICRQLIASPTLNTTNIHHLPTTTCSTHTHRSKRGCTVGRCVKGDTDYLPSSLPHPAQVLSIFINK